ncbi:DUF922 domain-containing Zn-dependent protease [Rhizobiaceae bacterium]|nr:DUF922 domain-containing Zn-dependent protease [Rhizobiaceae bacterium]
MNAVWNLGRITMCAAVALCLSVGAAQARVVINERTKTYTVSGSDGRQLFRSIAKRGPKSSRNQHAIATTRTDLKVQNVKTAVVRGRCVVTSVDVVLNLTYTYPKWNGSRRASPEVRKVWDNFLRQAIKHEETHGRISKDYARSVHRNFLKLRGTVSQGCADFGKRSANRLARAQARFISRQTRFDRREAWAISRSTRLQKALYGAR